MFAETYAAKVNVLTTKPTNLEAKLSKIASIIRGKLRPSKEILSRRQTEKRVETQILTEKKSKRYNKKALM